MSDTQPTYALVPNDFVPQETPVETPVIETPPETPLVETPTVEAPPEAPSPEAPATITPETIELPPPAPPAAATPEATPETQQEPPKAELTREDHIKALGLTPDFDKIIEAAKVGPDALRDYLKNVTADYDKAEPLELLRMDFDKKYSSLDKSERDALWAHTLETKYNITGDAEADKFANLVIKAEAEQIRSGLKEAQANYKLPEIKQPEPVPQVDEAKEQAYRQAVEIVENHPDLKQLEVSRTLKLGTGDDVFNYEIPAEVNLKDAVLKENLLASFWREENGKPVMDMNRFMKTKFYSENPEAYEQRLINHGKSLQAKKDLLELDNPATFNQGGTPPSSVPKYEVVKN